jgi:hypothetical protein
MRTLAIAEQTHTVLAGSERGVHASTDLGESWAQLPDGLGLSYPEVWSILVEDEEPLTLALGTYTRGFLRTAPGGGAWAAQNAGLRAAWATGLCAWDDSLLAGTAHGRLFLSPDGGQTWLDRSGTIDELHLYALMRLPSGRWLVGGNTRVWLSDDRGASWRNAGAGIPVGRAVFQFLQPPWLDAGVLYAATTSGVYRSDDFGESFAPLSGLPNPTAIYLAMAAAPLDSNIWLAAYQDDLRVRAIGWSSGPTRPSSGTTGACPTRSPRAFRRPASVRCCTWRIPRTCTWGWTGTGSGGRPTGAVTGRNWMRACGAASSRRSP